MREYLRVISAKFSALILRAGSLPQVPLSSFNSREHKSPQQPDFSLSSHSNMDVIKDIEVREGINNIFVTECS
jgi:hypothetical protein